MSVGVRVCCLGKRKLADSGSGWIESRGLFLYWKGESIQGELTIFLSIAAHDPKAIINELIENPGCKLKGAGPLEFHLECAISLGRFDICTAIMTLLCFHIAPQQGHIDRIKLARNPDGIICVRTNEPDYSNIQDIKYNWECSVYGPVSKLVPDDAPPLLHLRKCSGHVCVHSGYVHVFFPDSIVWFHVVTIVAIPDSSSHFPVCPFRQKWFQLCTHFRNRIMTTL